MRKVCPTAKQLCVELTGMRTTAATSLEEAAGKEGHSSRRHGAIFVQHLSFKWRGRIGMLLQWSNFSRHDWPNLYLKLGLGTWRLSIGPWTGDVTR